MTDFKALINAGASISGWCPYDPFPQFELHLSFVSKQDLVKIRNSCTRRKFIPDLNQHQQVLDDGHFAHQFVAKAIKGWRGLTFGILRQMVPCKSDNGVTDDTDVPFDPALAEELLVNAYHFDSWLQDAVINLIRSHEQEADEVAAKN